MPDQIPDPKTRNPECEEIQDLLYLFVIGELEPNEVNQVVLHLAKCAECQGALVQHAVLNKALTVSMPFAKPSVKSIQA